MHVSPLWNGFITTKLDCCDHYAPTNRLLFKWVPKCVIEAWLFATKPVSNSPFHTTKEAAHSKKEVVRKANQVIFQESTGKHELKPVRFWFIKFSMINQFIRSSVSWSQRFTMGFVSILGFCLYCPVEFETCPQNTTVFFWFGNLAMGSWKVFCAVLFFTQNLKTYRAIYCNKDILEYQQPSESTRRLFWAALVRFAEQGLGKLFQVFKTSHISTLSTALWSQ